MCVEECVMGKDKRRNFYFSNKLILAKLDKEENKSELLTQLLTDYYNKDMDYLEAEKQALAEKTSINQSRIDNLLAKRKQIKKIEDERIKKEKELLEIKQLSDITRNKWHKGEITDKQYWSLFKNNKLIKQKALKILNGINK